MGAQTEEYKQKTREMFRSVCGMSADEVEEAIRYDLEHIIADAWLQDEIAIVDLAIFGSRSRGKEREDSDLDIVVEIESDWNEDALFDLFVEEQLSLDGVPVDVNPITAEKTGTLDEYLPWAEKYLEEK